MRRTYRLDIEGKNRDRLVEASKHDIRKYIRRERRKELPKGADFWDFDTRFGTDEASAEVEAAAGRPACLVDGEMASWYGSRAAMGGKGQQIAAQVETIAKWKLQYDQMMSQIDQAKQQYESLTGSRGLGTPSSTPTAASS